MSGEQMLWEVFWLGHVPGRSCATCSGTTERPCDLPRPSDLSNPDAAADYAHGCEECGRPWHEHKPR